MSLFKTVIDSTTGRGFHLFGTATSILFNGEGVYGLTVNDTTKSAFFYNLNIKNDREGVVRVESEDGVHTIQSAVNESFLHRFITLSVYEDAINSADTENYTVLAKNICLAYNVDAGAIVYLRRGNLLKRIITVESIEEILLEAMLPIPGGIEIDDAFTGTADDTLLRMKFTGGLIDIDTISGDGALPLVMTVLIDDVSQDISSSAYFESLGGQYISFYLPRAVVYGEVIRITYLHAGGGGLGWNDSAGKYLEDFVYYGVLNNASEATTTTTTTSSTSTTSSTTSTSSTSTSSTSSTSTSSSSTSSTSTSTTSSSSTSTTTTTTTTLDDEEIWTDGVDTFRFIARDEKANLDQVINDPPGFDGGVEDTDWGNIWSKDNS